MAKYTSWQRVFKTFLAVCVITGIIIFLLWSRIVNETNWGRSRIYSRLEGWRRQVEIDPLDSKPLNALIECLLHGHSSFERAQAASQIAKLGNKAAPSIDALIEVLKNDDQYVSPQAVMALGNIGPQASRAMPMLIRAVRDQPNVDTGWLAAEAIGKVANPNDPLAWNFLRQAVRSDNQHIKARAEFGLQSLTERATYLKISIPSTMGQAK